MDERECESSVSFSSSSSSSESSSSDDGESSSSSKNSSWDNISGAHTHGGPLYHMNSLLLNLPCKRGLSKFFGGKSQSFSCVADVKCVEELSKELYHRKKKLKSSHSCGSRLNNNDLKNSSSYQPRISSACMISKRPQKASKMMKSKKSTNFVMNSRPPLSTPKIAS